MARPKKEFQTTVYLGDGQRKHIRASSKKELNAKVAELNHKKQEGKDMASNAEFGYYASLWLEDKERYGRNGEPISTKTMNGYRNDIERINQFFEHTDIRTIKLDDFQSFVDDLAERVSERTGRPLKRESIQKTINTASSIFDYASQRDIPVANFFKSVKIPVSAPKASKRKALSEQQINMILETPHLCQPVAMILLFTGIRPSELAPLRWSDVDLENGTISITKSVDLSEAGHPEPRDGGKTENARRTVHLPPILIEYLTEYRKHPNEYKFRGDVEKQNKLTSSLVVTSSNLEQLNNNSLRRMWESYMLDLNLKYGYKHEELVDIALDRTNRKRKKEDKLSRDEVTIDMIKYASKSLPMRIEPFTAYQLRHTKATFLFMENLPHYVIMLEMGHGDIRVTQKNYADFERYQERTKILEKHIHGDWGIHIA